MKFNLNPERALDWHQDGLNVAQFLNTMSLFFPVGERFFIDSVRHYRSEITDEELKKAVTAFIGQEAMHGREHDEYNQYVADAGVPIAAQEEVVTKLLNFVQRVAPERFQLAATVALEHLTAILGGGLLDLPEIMDGSEEGYKAIWNWHALEETEHKAVAFDVYQVAVGKDSEILPYIERSAALVLATGIFFSLFLPFYAYNVAIHGGLTDWKGWKAVWKHTWQKKGIFRNITKPWFDWFKPGFHPWDHDNREKLEMFAEILGERLDEAA
ncbi:FF domain protein [gamma proteobacterium HTCC5015]|nr:FF domain protein [gamma proteobacterium HTCC5015]